MLLVDFLPAQPVSQELWSRIQSSVAEIHIQKQLNDPKNPDSLRQILLNGALVDARMVPTIYKSFRSQAVGSQLPGYAVAYVGLSWNWLLQDAKDRQVAIEIVRADGQITPASLVGIDQRVGIVVLKTASAGTLSAATPVRNAESRASLDFYPVDLQGREPLGQKLSLKKTRSGAATEYWTSAHPRLSQGQLLFSADGEFWGFLTGTRKDSENQVVLNALPVDPALATIREIIDTGKDISAGWVGVFLDEAVSPSGRHRILITRVEPNSPALEAGLQPGDQVVEVNRQAVQSAQEFISRVRWSPPGSRMQFRVERQNKTIDLPVVISERKSAMKSERPSYYLQFSPAGPGAGEASLQIAEISPPQIPEESGPEPRRGPVLGFVGDDLTPQLGSFFGVQGGKGVLVNTVLPGGLAEKSGMKAGDVIVSLNGMEVVNQLGLAQEFSSQANVPVWLFRVMRERKPLEIKVSLPPRR